VLTPRWIARTLSLLIRPIAIPGWGIEYLVQKKYPRWRFTTRNAAPYFSCLFTLATVAAVYLPLPFAWIGFYPLGAAVLLASWFSVAIALGRRGTVYYLLREMARRDSPVSDTPLLGSSQAVFGAASAYLATAYCFGIWFLMVFRLDPHSFTGITDGGRAWLFWQFQYFSVVTVTTIGYGEIHPTTWLAQVGVVLEAIGGIAYVVFLFAAIVSYHVGRLERA